MARFDQFEETVGAVLDNIMTQLITMDSRLKKLENGVEVSYLRWHASSSVINVPSHRGNEYYFQVLRA